MALERFEDSGLTQAALRGPEFVPYAEDSTAASADRAHGQRGRGAASAASSTPTSGSWITCGHVHGCESRGLARQLRRIDAVCERLRDALPDDVRLVITGDHGMIDIPTEQQIVAEDDPSLMAGVSALAGEPRFRQLYVDQDQPGPGGCSAGGTGSASRAWVRTRDEAIDEGWFGPVDDQLRERYGHVLVAMRADWAVMTRQLPRELTLVGMHGLAHPGRDAGPAVRGLSGELLRSSGVQGGCPLAYRARRPRNRCTGAAQVRGTWTGLLEARRGQQREQIRSAVQGRPPERTVRRSISSPDEHDRGRRRRRCRRSASLRAGARRTPTASASRHDRLGAGTAAAARPRRTPDPAPG